MLDALDRQHDVHGLVRARNAGAEIRGQEFLAEAFARVGHDVRAPGIEAGIAKGQRQRAGAAGRIEHASAAWNL